MPPTYNCSPYNNCRFCVFSSSALFLLSLFSLLLFAPALFPFFLPDNTRHIYFIHIFISIFLFFAWAFERLWACLRRVMRHYALPAFFMRRTAFYHICIHQYLCCVFLQPTHAFLFIICFISFRLANKLAAKLNLAGCDILYVIYSKL